MEVRGRGRNTICLPPSRSGYDFYHRVLVQTPGSKGRSGEPQPYCTYQITRVPPPATEHTQGRGDLPPNPIPLPHSPCGTFLSIMYFKQIPVPRPNKRPLTCRAGISAKDVSPPAPWVTRLLRALRSTSSPRSVGRAGPGALAGAQVQGRKRSELHSCQWLVRP